MKINQIKKKSKEVIKSNYSCFLHLFIWYVIMFVVGYLINCIISSLIIFKYWGFKETLYGTIMNHDYIITKSLDIPINNLLLFMCALAIMSYIIQSQNNECSKIPLHKYLLKRIKEHNLYKRTISFLSLLFIIDLAIGYLLTISNIYLSKTQFIQMSIKGPFFSEPVLNSISVTLFIIISLLLLRFFLMLIYLYIFLNPTEKLRQSISTSIKKTFTNILRIFGFEASFIHWGLLVLICYIVANILNDMLINNSLTFQILLRISFGLSFYIWPYYYTSKMMFYKSLFHNYS